MEEPFQPEQKESGNQEPIHDCKKNKGTFFGWREHLAQEVHVRNGGGGGGRKKRFFFCTAAFGQVVSVPQGMGAVGKTQQN